jgi:hypothetical protein
LEINCPAALGKHHGGRFVETGIHSTRLAYKDPPAFEHDTLI